LTAGFEVREGSRGTAHVLTLTGELDLASGGVLAEAISRACADGAQTLVLDIRTLEFIDSTGLRELVAGRALCDEHGCVFQITEGRSRVERVFEIAGLLDFFAPCRTEGDRADQLA
jgi:anti-anti-sigma factor